MYQVSFLGLQVQNGKLRRREMTEEEIKEFKKKLEENKKKQEQIYKLKLKEQKDKEKEAFKKLSNPISLTSFLSKLTIDTFMPSCDK